MAHYGRDYTSGRFTRRNFDDYGTGYDSDFGPGYQGGGWSSGFNQGRGNFDRTTGWGNRGRPGGTDNFDESWRSTGTGRGRSGFGEQDWSGNNEFRGGGYTGSGYTGGGYGSSGFGRRTGSYGGFDRGFYDREMQGQGRFGREYDQDFGDRLRRGWNRFREEARGWMGRGYDRGW